MHNMTEVLDFEVGTGLAHEVLSVDLSRCCDTDDQGLSLLAADFL